MAYLIRRFHLEEAVDILNGNIKKIYFKYLAASFGSTLISSIYCIVDMAVVGQYHGPEGSAALAVFAPIWNIIYSFGLLAGVSGSVLFSAVRGETGDQRKSNEYFSAAIIYGVVLSAIAWAAIYFFNKSLLLFFGADELLLPLAQRYLMPIKFTVPIFVFTQILTAFLRNDNDPALATVSVLAGGIFNVFGDLFFVFALDMGIYGAGLATAMGAVISLLVMLLHFLRQGNTLRFVKPTRIYHKLGKITVNGFSTCITDIAMGVMTILFNRQIMRFLGSDYLAVYGVIVNISTIVQCCAYSVGQASQPIFSINYGAGKTERIRETLEYALYTAVAFGVVWMVSSLAAPNMYVRIFMAPTKAVLEIAPNIIRTYGLSFLLLPMNVFSTYYFQALMKPGISFAISMARGCVISGGLILLLPAIASPMSVWYAMPVTEAAVAAFAAVHMAKSSRIGEK